MRAVSTAFSFKYCFINYGEAGVIVPAPEYALGSRQLVKGMTGKADSLQYRFALP